MKVYIATGLENAKESSQLENRLIEDGWERTYDWTKHGSVQDDGPERIAQVAVDEINGVLQADLLIALLPGGRGTHIEIGCAIGHGIPVILFGKTEKSGTDRDRLVTWPEPRRDPDANGRECAFHRHPKIVWVERDRGFDGVRLEAYKIWTTIQEPREKDRSYPHHRYMITTQGDTQDA